MSGRISISSVDFTAFPLSFDRVRCVSIRLSLVRNWCGPRSQRCEDATRFWCLEALGRPGLCLQNERPARDQVAGGKPRGRRSVQLRSPLRCGNDHARKHAPIKWEHEPCSIRGQAGRRLRGARTRPLRLPKHRVPGKAVHENGLELLAKSFARACGRFVLNIPLRSWIEPRLYQLHCLVSDLDRWQHGPCRMD